MHRAPLLLACLVLGCGSDQVKTALDYVAVCAPGGSVNACDEALHRALRSDTQRVFPAGDLTSIEIQSVNVSHDGLSVLHSRMGAFRHAMFFRGGYGTVKKRVVAMLEDELGPMLKHGRPPIAWPAVEEGDVWMTGDGYWICTDDSVVWYANPLRYDRGPNDLDPFPAPGNPDARKYVRPAPVSGSLWKRVGRLLVTY